MPNIEIPKNKFDDKDLATSPEVCKELINREDDLKTLNTHENPHNNYRDNRNYNIEIQK